MKKKIILLSVILLLLFLLCYPTEALAAARNGLKLWLETLLPTLLPFMILTGILVHTDWITKILQPTAPFSRSFLGFLQEEPMYFFWDFSLVTLWGQN